jgi:uncharacterized protein (UPF0303 family)
LQFERFDSGVAWELGLLMREMALQRGAVIAFDMSLGAQTLFFHSMPGATPNNANWVRRKRNTVLHFHRSSYGLGLQLERDKVDFTAKFGLSLSDYALHGGGFPVRVAQIGVVGAVAISGLPQREDHELVVEVLARFLGKPLADCLPKN